MRFIAALLLVSVPAMAETPSEVAVRYNLAGEMLIAKGGKVVLDQGFGTVSPGGGKPHKTGARWRLASITKQVTAALVLRKYLPARPGFLDEPLNFGTATPSTFKVLNGLTPRQLLTHHSGLANPDATPLNAEGVPRFYATDTNSAFCLSQPPRPGADFSYNNCDYLMLPWPGAWPAGMKMAQRGDYGVPGFVKGKPEPRFNLASFGEAGGLIGTARAVFAFDRALMTGQLLPPVALAALWRPEGKGSYQALGQWVFPGTLRGCAKPKRIVQRDGEIWGVQARNFIFPDDDLVVIVFTNRSSDDFAFGEAWEGKGFTYDLLSAAACSA